MKSMMKACLILAIAVLGLSARSNAQTLKGLGSSAMYLELGEAAGAADASGSMECVWSKGSGTVSAVDTGASVPDNGQVWAAWAPGSSSDCTTVNTSMPIYAYLQTDSVVGDRCLSNAINLGSCTITNFPTSGSATTPAGLVLGSVAAESTLISDVANALNSSAVNFAGTDIRPEDAYFAITRALTSCGTAITQYTGGSGSPTQYLGLGYTSGGTIVGNSNAGGSTFNVVSFTLPADGFTVSPLGAVPVVVAVNSTDPAGTGFNSTAITNLNRSTLALYLDGSIGSTQDALTPALALPGGYTPEPATVYVREPLSGTYNTMEYNIPNNVELQTSQDVGLNQIPYTPGTPSTGNQNCNGTVPAWNSATVNMGTLAGNVKQRAIGTGNELAAVFGHNDTLGYSFWGVGNFKAAPTTAKYLTVDGVDPIENTYGAIGTFPAGAIPTPTSGVGPSLANVTLAHVADGTYPIWSLIRLVSDSSSPITPAVQTLAADTQSYVSFGLATSQPDFIPYNSLAVERAHFATPGTSSGPVTLSNGVCGLTAGRTSFTEAGGDVGGMVIPCMVDADYYADTNAAGAASLFVGTSAPSSSRRQ